MPFWQAHLPKPLIYSTIDLQLNLKCWNTMSVLRFYFHFYFSYPSPRAVEKR